jgi:signal transduction histidine kinase
MTQASPSKPSGVSGTGSPHNLFRKAQLKLTGLYVLIIAVIIVGFSIFLYHSTTRNFSDASDEDFAATSSQQHFIAYASGTLQRTLVLSDIVILFLAAGISYALARRTLRPVEVSHEAQRIFAAKASHELRTPLAIMRNDIEVLLRDAHPAPAQVRSTLDSTLEEIEKMTAMVGDLLLLARSEQPQNAIQAAVPIDPLIANVVAKIQPLALAKGITISHAPRSKDSVRGSEEALGRALLNVVKNSIEHTPPGGTISIELTRSRQNVEIRVSDTGAGIHPDDLAHVFDRFYKGQASTEQGTGLGLAIVKEIVEQYGGTVRIGSQFGKGTHVSIVLPLIA